MCYLTHPTHEIFFSQQNNTCQISYGSRIFPDAIKMRIRYRGNRTTTNIINIRHSFIRRKITLTSYHQFSLGFFVNSFREMYCNSIYKKRINTRQGMPRMKDKWMAKCILTCFYSLPLFHFSWLWFLEICRQTLEKERKSLTL